MKPRFKILLVLLLLGAGIALFWVQRSRTKPERNFLLITIDTLRADHLGAYGYSRNTSPNLDRLAAEGSVFENAFCVMPTTLPSHGSLFFSTWPRIHGSTSNFILFSNETLVFLPDLLRQNGYAVGALASAPHLAKHLKTFASFGEMAVPNREKTAEETLRSARGWLKKNDSGKFFLWIHLWDPHSPYHAHTEFLPQVGANTPPAFSQQYAYIKNPYDPTQVRAMIDLYDSEIAYTDHHLGAFLDSFRKEHGDDTMIMVTSDHGETLDELLEGEGYAFDHGEYLYDHQLRVPLIVVQPDAEAQGQRISGAVSLLDVMPTVLQAAGIPLPSSAQGASLLPLMNRTTDRPASLVYLQRRDFQSPPRPFLAQRQFGIREREFKLLWDEQDNQGRLYRNGREVDGAQLGSDKVRDQLQQRLQQWLQATSAYASGARKDVPPEDAELLRSLGYIQ